MNTTLEFISLLASMKFHTSITITDYYFFSDLFPKPLLPMRIINWATFSLGKQLSLNQTTRDCKEGANTNGEREKGCDDYVLTMSVVS